MFGKATTKRTTQTRNLRSRRVSSDEGTRQRIIASASARLLKEACPEIVPSLTHIIIHKLKPYSSTIISSEVAKNEK